MMLEFERLWAFALLPLPWLAWKYLPPRAGSSPLPVPEGVASVLETVSGGTGTRRILRNAMTAKIIGFFALLTAMAGPHTLDSPLVAKTGQDIVLAIDVSASMGEPASSETPRTAAIDMVRSAFADFLAGRSGDRTALIAFADTAYVLSPLSHDNAAVAAMLDELVVGLAGRRTNLGHAVGLAYKSLRDTDADTKSVIVVSDGAANTGKLRAGEAAQIAATAGISVHAISLAHEAGSAEDANLRSVAETSGGEFHRATNPEELDLALAALSRTLQPGVVRTGPQPRTDWSWLPLCVALGALSVTAWREARSA